MKKVANGNKIGRNGQGHSLLYILLSAKNAEGMKDHRHAFSLLLDTSNLIKAIDPKSY